MKNLFLSFGILFSLSFNAQTSINYHWSHNFGASDVDQELRGGIVDGQGNTIVGGYLDGDLDLDPSIGGVTSFTGYVGGFIAKYSPSGALLWAGNFEGSASNKVFGIDVDASNNIYVLGKFELGDADFDFGPSQSTLTAIYNDVFLAKYDAAGNYQWVVHFGESNAVLTPYGIRVTPSGEICLGGEFNNFFSFGPGTATLTTVGGVDAFIAKYNTSGNFVWAHGFGGLGNDRAFGVDINASGEVAVTGQMQFTVDLDPGAGNNDVITNGGDDIFISKFDNGGTFLWGGSMGGDLNDVGGRVRYNNAGDIVLSSVVSSGTFDINPMLPVTPQVKIGDPGYLSILLSKLNGTNGSLIWGKTAGALGQNEAMASALKIDSQNNIFIGGRFSGVMDIDLNPGTTTLSAITNSNSDIFVAKYKDANADLVFGFNLGGGDQNGNNCENLSIRNDTLYLMGVNTNTMDMDPGIASPSLGLEGLTDFFISKYTFCTLPNLTGLSGSAPICIGNTVTLSVTSGTLNDAPNWSWFTGSCTGSLVATGASVSLNPTTTTIYFVKGNGGCVPPGGACQQTSITVNPNTNIGGNVTSNTISAVPVAGQVLLFKYEPNLTKFDTIVKQNIGVGGAFNLTSVPAASYILQAIPNANTLIPTYAPNQMGWKDAIIINHGCISNDIQNIDVKELFNFGAGPGILSGKIVEGTKYGQKGLEISVPGQPIKGISVKGGRNPGGNIGAQDRTLPNGSYTLAGLPNNIAGESYFVFVDIQGLDTANAYHKIVTDGNNQFFDLDFVVDSVKIYPAIFVGANENLISEKNFKIYPNPSNGKIYVECELEKPSFLSIELFDIMGKKIGEPYPVSFESSRNITVISDQSKLSNGIYLLKVKIDSKEYVKRISIVK
ncbi:MAG: T9SS type A sorting domain-containing protein [Sphingobacteriaceae bacterium]|nr:T9SS type A sorting domain-containing protein [Sphingobacteriaceae bacterium]